MKKLFKYIDGTLNGYTPVSCNESKELKNDGWNTDANTAYENQNQPGKYDDDFRVDVDALKKAQSNK